MKIYLAGGMKGTWQDDARALAPSVEWLDPREWSTPDPAIYTARDLEAVRASDCILAHMDSSNPSGFGMALEIGYAIALGKRVVFWDGIREDWRSRYFDMVRQTCEVRTTCADAVAACLKQ